jgi:7-cyano-7-deazaguanine reductase
MSENKPRYGLSYEGLQGHIKRIKLPAIQAFKNIYPEKKYSIRLEIPEFTCICPKTSLPDFATIIIEYTPDKLCIELKALKEYILAYRNLGIFHENAVNRILDDFVKSCKPRRVKVEGIFNVRGGIKASVLAEYNKSGR